VDDGGAECAPCPPAAGAVMVGHALLEGCTGPWRHDACPGRLPSPPHPTDALVIGGGMVCHCPCHGLQHEIDRLRAQPPDEETLRRALPAWLDRIAPSIPAFIARHVVQHWAPSPPASRPTPAAAPPLCGPSGGATHPPVFDAEVPE
jgi:hypothetical protein